MKELAKGSTLSKAALKAAIDPKTARRYRYKGCSAQPLPQVRNWRTRSNPFGEHWPEIEKLMAENPGVEAKTIFEHLCRSYCDFYEEGQLRTLQRLIKKWRNVQGHAKPVMFPQKHHPGELSASDFTWAKTLRVTINAIPFPHMFYHFVLTYSNWEDVTLCFSETFESLSAGLQNAFEKIGGVTKYHKTDNLAAAYRVSKSRKSATVGYQSLLSHYGVQGKTINAGKSNENGDVESSNRHLKSAIEQGLILRGSRDFQSREKYMAFVFDIINKKNATRMERFLEEKKSLKQLPGTRLIEGRRFEAKVSPSSTLKILHNIYSVHSRLIGETVRVFCYWDRFEVYSGENRVEVLPRLCGEGGHHIQYRHIIDSLRSKPGAFDNYRYREALFPTSNFRIAYDELLSASPATAVKQYLHILDLAAKESQDGVESAIRKLLQEGRKIEVEYIEALMLKNQPLAEVYPEVKEPNLSLYDELIKEGGCDE